MNFDLKTLDLAGAVAEKCDLLVLLVPDGFVPGEDALSVMVAQATRAKDLETKPGKSLQLYQVPGIAARRVVLAGMGKGDARSIRQVFGAIGAVFKNGSVKRAVVCLAGPQAEAPPEPPAPPAPRPSISPGTRTGTGST